MKKASDDLRQEHEAILTKRQAYQMNAGPSVLCCLNTGRDGSSSDRCGKALWIIK
jgi:hypothetical protein